MVVVDVLVVVVEVLVVVVLELVVVVDVVVVLVVVNKNPYTFIYRDKLSVYVLKFQLLLHASLWGSMRIELSLTVVKCI